MVDTDRLAAAVLAGVAAVAGSFAVGGATPAFVVTPAFDVVARFTPGFVVGFFVTTYPGFADYLAYGVAAFACVVGLSALAWAVAAVGVRVSRPLAGAAVAGLAVWGAIAVTTSYGLRAFVPGLAAFAVLAYVSPSRSFAPSTASRRRRRVLRAAAGVVGFAAIAGYVGRGTTVREPVPADGRFRTDRETGLEADAAAKSLDVPGLGGLLSSNAGFYQVDIDASPPVVDPTDWTLSFDGAVTGADPLAYDDVVTHPDRTAVVDTLRCVSDQVEGSLSDTAVWTGIPVSTVLGGLDVSGSCGCVMVHAADGYEVEFPVSALRSGFLAVGMNGDPLPREHGYPVRLLVPGHWGEVNCKWVTSFEFLEREALGYWEQRGWQGTGPVNTVTKIRVTDRSNGTVTLAGVAYAGTRGIDRVEVSTDGGDTWHDATLSDELDGALHGDVWRQWSYAFPAPSGVRTVVARAVDGTGAVQSNRTSDPYPNGASGWARRRING